MTKQKLLSLLAATALMPLSMLAQAPTATIHGHVNNAAGIAVPKAQIQLTTDKTLPEKQQKMKYTFETDANGDFKGTDIAPGDYLIWVLANNVHADYQEMTLKAGVDEPVNFDMTRKEYIDKMSPEDRANLEEYKKKIAATMSANAMINNLNAALKQVREDMASATPNYDNDIATMQGVITKKPDEPVLYYVLGSTLIGSADAKVKAAKEAHQSWQSDATITKLYSDGVDAYKKGIDLNAASKKPSPADAAVAWNAIGNADAKMSKIPEAEEAWDNAVKLAPASAGLAYSNEAAVLLNANQSDAAATAADKAIAADPTRPDPYYIKGQALVTKATVDSKTGKIVAPPGCIEAYQKYLELAPDGPRAADVRDILTGMGQTVNTKYSAPGAKPGKAVKVPPAK